MSDEEYIKLLPPLSEQVLSANDADWLLIIYKQLYPSKNISFFSSFCCRCQKVLYGNDYIGSGNEHASAVIMAYWYSTGNSLECIDYSTCQVGIIQYFIKHTIKFSGSTNKEDHFINWKKNHYQYDGFGKSAVVSSVLNEINDVCCLCRSNKSPTDVPVVQYQLISILLMRKFLLHPHLHKLLYLNVLFHVPSQ